MENNDKNNRKKIEDILSSLRAKGKGPSKFDGSTLRSLFDDFKKDGTIDQDYKDTPIYRLGFEDGESMGHEIASQSHLDELYSIKTIIDAMINSK